MPITMCTVNTNFSGVLMGRYKVLIDMGGCAKEDLALGGSKKIVLVGKMYFVFKMF